MAKKYKIIVPKPAANDQKGMEVKLFKADEIVESQGDWQDEIMDGFVANGWAMEVKVDSVDATVDIEAEVEPAMERIKVEGEEGEVEGWRFHYQVQLYALL